MLQPKLSEKLLVPIHSHLSIRSSYHRIILSYLALSALPTLFQRKRSKAP